MSTELETRGDHLSWFRRIPRHFFTFPLWGYALYVGLGYWLAAALHFRVWRESQQVETIFTKLGIDVVRPTPAAALVLFLMTGVLATVVFYLLLLKIRRDAGILELVFWGTIASLTLAWIPWLYASSVVSTVFLFLFGMIGLTGFGLAHRRLIHRNEEVERRPDPWKMFVNATKACAAVLAILLGAIATSVLLPWRNSEVEEFELMRYAFLCAYVVVGMIMLILMPLLTKSLEEDPIEHVDLEPPGPI